MDDFNQLKRRNDAHVQQTTNPSSQPGLSIAPITADRYRGSTDSRYNYGQAPTLATSLDYTSQAGYRLDYSHGSGQQITMYQVAQPSAETPGYTQQFGSQWPVSTTTPDVASTYFGASATHNPYPHPTSLQGPSQTYQRRQYSSDATSDNIPAQHPEKPENEQWHDYHQQLAAVFQNISKSSLQTASKTLLSISNWLLPRVEALGLTTDNESLHSERVKLWDDFNHAWLALGQKQFDLTKDPEHLPPSARILSYDALQNLGDRIVRHCNALEKHGLVDYQYGVSEERIMESKRTILGLLGGDG